MLYHIDGTVCELEPNFTVIDCDGIGFCLYVTANTLSYLHIGEKAKLFVAESIGETNFDLYGFYTKAEKKCFEMLTSVSGIGPKAAMSILSYNSPESLAAAVINNDEKALSAAPGIGKKTALRVILELKDKIGKNFADSSVIAPVSLASDKKNSETNDAYAALNILGYSNSEAAKALAGIDLSGLSTEQIIKRALKNLG